MSELKPVAYKRIYDDDVIGYGEKKSTRCAKNIPLYTREQLQPRIKMTRSMFKEFMEITMGRNLLGLYGSFKKIFEGSEEYPNLYKSFETHQGQVEFAKVWYNFDREHPEKTIEFVPDKKFFVVTKETNDIDKYEFLRDINFAANSYGSSDTVENVVKFGAWRFDTRAEAEEWVNPLTEAVLLPVE